MQYDANTEYKDGDEFYYKGYLVGVRSSGVSLYRFRDGPAEWLGEVKTVQSAIESIDRMTS